MVLLLQYPITCLIINKLACQSKARALEVQLFWSLWMENKNHSGTMNTEESGTAGQQPKKSPLIAAVCFLTCSAFWSGLLLSTFRKESQVAAPDCQQLSCCSDTDSWTLWLFDSLTLSHIWLRQPLKGCIQRRSSAFCVSIRAGSLCRPDLVAEVQDLATCGCSCYCWTRIKVLFFFFD